MLTCRDAHALIVRTIDHNGLSGEARAALRRHVASCVRCSDEYETQHEVRRLLALHIEEPLLAAFAERLDARLAQESTRRLSRLRRSMRWRTWSLRLIPVAATLAVIVADGRVWEVVTRRATSSDARPGEIATIVPPRRDAAAPASSRHREMPRLSTEILLHSSVQPSKSPGHVQESPELAEALKLSDTQRKQIEEIDDMRRQALWEILESTRKQVELEQFRTDAAIERVLTPEQRRRYRERHANRERDASPERDASEQPGILPRPSAPLPPVQPPLPLADRSVPPL